MNGTSAVQGDVALPEVPTADELASEVSTMGPVEAAEALAEHGDELVFSKGF